jgi:pimeloyl-ACP methyl ester carboxylesterase
VQNLDLLDPTRSRPIPVAYYPARSPSKGWLLFSVGFGGARSGYAFLARAWSEMGLDVAVIEHVGSNLEVLKSLQRPGMRAAELAHLVGQFVQQGPELEERPLDLLYVRQQLCPGARWAGCAGHSFGAYTAAAVCLRAAWQGACLLSPSPPGNRLSGADYAQLQLPVFVLTGTLDSGMPAGVTYQDRLQAFAALPTGQRYLALLEGADHMALAGVGLQVGPITRSLTQLTSAFWQSLLEKRPPQWPECEVETTLAV